ncbi:MAG: hypothetical protein WBM11_10230 [Terriglobales bacterium]
MRRACVFLFLLALPLAAKDREWQDSVYLGLNSTNSGAMAVPIGGAIVAAPLRSDHLWFRVNRLTYCLYFPSRLSGRIPNLTVNGHTKIALDGRRAYIRDDDGKQWKLNIVEKIAPREEPAK